MSDSEHILEKRSHLLAQRLTARVNLIRQAVAPSGERPPFSVQLSKKDALKFWREHWNDDIGKQALAYMTPTAIMELNVALSKANEQVQQGGIVDDA